MATYSLCPNSAQNAYCNNIIASICYVYCTVAFSLLVGSVAYQSARYGRGTNSMLLDDVQCVGNETRLLDCRRVTIHNSGHPEDASV